MKLFKAVNSYSKLQIESEAEIVRKGILIVDDSKFSRNILKDILKTEGYLIVGEAGDGLEAIDMAREKKPEYIFMDVEMPKLDGLGAISKILEIDPKIKIVMCTALGQKNIILEAAKAGAKDYILKPYNKDNIIDVLHEITDKNQKEGQVIPFKAGKNHHEDINYKPLTETERPQPYAEAEPLQPLVNDDDNAVNESLDSSFDQESLQDSTPEEVLESYLNEELQEKADTEDEAKSKESIAVEEILKVVENVTEGEAEENPANIEISEEIEIVTEDKAEESPAIEELLEEARTAVEDEADEKPTIGELLEEARTAAKGEAEENQAIKEIPDDETVERAKFVMAVLNEDNSKGADTIGEAEPEKAAVEVDTSKADSTTAEAEPEEAIAEEDTSKADTTTAEAEPEEAIAEEDTSKADTTAAEAEPEEVIAEEDTSKADTSAAEAEPEEVIAEEDTSKADTSAAEAEPEKAVAEEDTSKADSSAAEAEPEETITDQDTSEADISAVEVEPEKALVNVGLPENVNSLEITNQDIKSDSNSYTYLWNNRFDILQKEVIPQNTVSQRVSFYEYAYLDTGKYDTFIKDNLQREIALGMMKAYMSLNNRLQQDDSTTTGLRTLTYSKENRFFISNVLEKSNDKLTEITIVNEIKYNSLKLKQTSQEITVKTGFYQLVSDFVNGKSGRVLR